MDSQRSVACFLEVFLTGPYRAPKTVEISIDGRSATNEYFAENEKGVKWPMFCTKADAIGRELAFKVLEGDEAGCQGSLSINEGVFDREVEVPLTMKSQPEVTRGIIKACLTWGARGQVGRGARQSLDPPFFFAQELRGMKESELKAIANQHGIDCSACVEKADIIGAICAHKP